MKVKYEHKKAMSFIGFSTSIRPDEGNILCSIAKLSILQCPEIIFPGSGYAA